MSALLHPLANIAAIIIIALATGVVISELSGSAVDDFFDRRD